MDLGNSIRAVNRFSAPEKIRTSVRRRFQIVPPLFCKVRAVVMLGVGLPVVRMVESLGSGIDAVRRTLRSMAATLELNPHTRLRTQMPIGRQALSHRCRVQSPA